MLKITSIFNFRLIPLSLGITLAVVATVEIAISRIAPNIASIPQLHRIEKIKHSVDLNNDYDILILGDSYNSWAIKPDLISQRTGLKTYNFGVYGKDSIFMPYCILKNYLQTARHKPKFIILGFVHSSFNLEEIYSDSVYDYDRHCTAEFIRDHGPVRWFFSLFPSFRYAWWFQYAIVYRELFWRTDAELKQLREELANQNGYYSPEPNGIWDREKTPRAAKGYPDFSLADYSFVYFKKIADLAEKNSIKVLYNIPSSPDGAVSKYNEFLKPFALARLPEFQLLDPQTELADDGYYNDGWHLNEQGANLLSLLVADKVNEMLK